MSPILSARRPTLEPETMSVDSLAVSKQSISALSANMKLLIERATSAQDLFHDALRIP
jgi:hypothetical protein